MRKKTNEKKLIMEIKELVDMCRKKQVQREKVEKELGKYFVYYKEHLIRGGSYTWTARHVLGKKRLSAIEGLIGNNSFFDRD